MCIIQRALQALQGCTVPALYTGLYRLCTISRVVQALHDTQGYTYRAVYAGCTDSALYAGLYRPCPVRRVVQAEHYTLGCKGPTLYAGLCRHSTIYWAVKAMHS